MNAKESLTPGTFWGALMIALFSVLQGFLFSYLRHDTNESFFYCMVLYGPLLLTLTYVLIIEAVRYRGISLGHPASPILSLDTALMIVFAVGSPYIIGLAYYALTWIVGA